MSMLGSLAFFLKISNNIINVNYELTQNLIELAKKLVSSGHQLLLSIIASIIALVTPAIPVIITVFAFIFADTYYGYKVSTRYGNKLESKKLWKMCNKVKEALTVIVLGLLLDKFILATYADLAAVKIAAGTICAAEGISLLESFRALHPRSLLSKILAKVIKSKSEKYLDVDLSDIIDIKEFTDDTNDNTINNKLVL